MPGSWGRSKLGSGPIEPVRGSPGCSAPPSGDLVLPCMVTGSPTQARWPPELLGVGEEVEVPRPPQLGGPPSWTCRSTLLDLNSTRRCVCQSPLQLGGSEYF